MASTKCSNADEAMPWCSGDVRGNPESTVELIDETPRSSMHVRKGHAPTEVLDSDAAATLEIHMAGMVHGEGLGKRKMLWRDNYVNINGGSF
jgi:hypothetical protein